MRFHQAIVAAGVLAASAYASTASAQITYPIGGTLGWPYNFYQDEYIPYYALHPPVYYSQPVARTYGWSPWAYPPGVLTPEVGEVAEPKTIINPYVPQEDVPSKAPEKAKATSDRSARVQPRIIDNPFVESAQIAHCE